MDAYPHLHTNIHKGTLTYTYVHSTHTHTRTHMRARMHAHDTQRISLPPLGVLPSVCEVTTGVDGYLLLLTGDLPLLLKIKINQLPALSDSIY